MSEHDQSHFQTQGYSRSALFSDRDSITLRTLWQQMLHTIELIGKLRTNKRKHSVQHPERGSAEMILQGLDSTDPLQFAPGELDILLADIEHQRTLDLEANDRLSAWKQTWSDG